MAETLIRYRMLDEMRSSEEDDTRVEQRGHLLQRVRQLVDAQTQCARNVFTARRISRSRMWRLAQCTLTKDVMWRVALSAMATPRTSHSYRVPMPLSETSKATVFSALMREAGDAHAMCVWLYGLT